MEERSGGRISSVVELVCEDLIWFLELGIGLLQEWGEVRVRKQEKNLRALKEGIRLKVSFLDGMVETVERNREEKFK